MPASPPTHPQTRLHDMADQRPPTPTLPLTGEVRAGPGDAGMADHPRVNTRPVARKPLSNRRLAIGLGIAAVLTIVPLILTALL